MELPTEGEPVRVVQGDCLEVLRTLPDGSVDSVVSDPPYELGFMGKDWDRSGVAFDPATWAAVLRVLKPGGYLLAMGGTRTYHRLAVAVEDAGFEARDCLMWLYGTGFPKGQGCLKPAWEPILLARKPGKRVLPLGIDACRVPTDKPWTRSTPYKDDIRGGKMHAGKEQKVYECGPQEGSALGRYPANVLHDGSDEVLEAFAAFGESKSDNRPRKTLTRGIASGMLNDDAWQGKPLMRQGHTDNGTAARFFYCAKASRAERGDGNTHPTVKPLELMKWLVRLVCPPGGVVLDPFLGSGTVALAALAEGRRAIGIERHPPYADIARRRVREAMGTGLLSGVL